MTMPDVDGIRVKEDERRLPRAQLVRHPCEGSRCAAFAQ